MEIRIYRSSFGGWMPTSDAWEQHRQILIPLCIGGNISFRRKEDLVDYLSSRGLISIEEGTNKETDTEQLLLF